MIEKLNYQAVSDKQEVVLIGYSGHGYVVGEAAIIADFNLRYYADKSELLLNPFELAYLGFDGDEKFQGWSKGYRFILGIGDNDNRQKIALSLSAKGESLLTIVHPHSSISKKSQIGSGVFIARNVSVNPLATIGDYTILNTGSVIEHECIIGNSAHIAPGAVLAGNVKVGDRSFIGANSVIKQGVEIGKDVIVGAGSVIITNIPDGGKFTGNPARPINER
jgi:sugar O-acyltransferase (sialic acid O-acetyltransferase NeuD family)